MTLQERALTLADEATDLVELIDNADWQQALVAFNNMADVYAKVGIHLAQTAYDAGLSKEQIATGLNVDARDLRNLKEKA